MQSGYPLALVVVAPVHGKHEGKSLPRPVPRCPRYGPVAQQDLLMDVLYERWAGLDGHTASVVACLITPAPSGHPLKQLRTFGTVTP